MTPQQKQKLLELADLIPELEAQGILDNIEIDCLIRALVVYFQDGDAIAALIAYFRCALGGDDGGGGNPTPNDKFNPVDRKGQGQCG